MTKFTAFLNDETGAVTVDWVVLTAAVVGLGLAVMAAITPSISNVANAISGGLDDAANMDLGYGAS